MTTDTSTAASASPARTKTAGHLSAIFTIVVWGTTFISTKVLLDAFSPIEILFIRFVIGYLALWCVCPRVLHVKDRRQDWCFAAAGLCGVTLYYLFENIALTYTLTSHVSVMVSMAPFFTSLLSCLVLRERYPGARFYLGFLVAMCGICLISFQGSSDLKLSLTGDLLAIAAAGLWALYSILTKMIGNFGYSVIQSTRRTFFFGILFMLPVIWRMGFDVQPSDMLQTTNLLNLIFLGFGASALCFVTWNYAVRSLGSVKTSVYIYAVPVITTVTSGLILKESVTPAAVCGIALTLAGLLLSQKEKGKPS